MHESRVDDPAFHTGVVFAPLPPVKLPWQYVFEQVAVPVPAVPPFHTATAPPVTARPASTTSCDPDGCAPPPISAPGVGWQSVHATTADRAIAPSVDRCTSCAPTPRTVVAVPPPNATGGAFTENVVRVPVESP